MLLWSPSANALKVELDTPVVGVDVDLDDGVDVGVDVPAVGAEIDANVDTGQGTVEVDAGVNPPSSNAGSGENNNTTAGDDSSSTGNGSKPDSRSGSGDAQSSVANDSPSEASRQAADPVRSRADRATRPSLGGADLQAAADQAGLVGLVLASSRSGQSAAVDPPQDEVSVVAQLVDHIPAWLWLVLGLLGAALLITGAYALHERSRRRAEHEIALRDPLTGVANLKAFETRLNEEWDRAQRYGSKLGVLMIDLDRFKEVNDQHGHAAGDEVLIATAAELNDLTRTSDLVARVGGDEFAVVCPETSLRGLQKMIAHLERTVPSAAGFGVGVSIGAAEMQGSDARPSEMTARADLAMYDRKSARKRSREADASLSEAV